MLQIYNKKKPFVKLFAIVLFLEYQCVENKKLTIQNRIVNFYNKISRIVRYLRADTCDTRR